ncbi:hypothetical protein B0A52_02623 [Exophiala mesophila]|uniref:Zn(2)-C6 fungal-type domain-containing protein n=1 Tax=Exophiala mesophila TaxID=212818 RepID=A0A438ND61_EXOME|nr:hypothetical protein B0A52_02623 [Exophiala mesophila]
MGLGRTKRPHQKVKTGCMTCRKRRIKCDEGKPACRQCTSSLRKCEGYQPPQTWLFVSRKTATTNKANPDQDEKSAVVTQTEVPQLLSPPSTLSPLSALGDSDDQRSFQYWIEKGAPLFSCYFGYYFWTYTLPKLSIAEPAVTNLLLATASLCETSFIAKMPIHANAVWRKHYTAALQGTLNNPRCDAVLLACLLFACCEIARGNITSALHHVESGIAIINEWSASHANKSSKTTKESDFVIRAIAPMFIGYIHKAPTYGMHPLSLRPTEVTYRLVAEEELPAFGQLDALYTAHHSLTGIAHQVARLLDQDFKPHVPVSAARIQDLLNCWQASFEMFEKNMLRNRRQCDPMYLRLLRVNYTMLTIMFKASQTLDEAVYADFEREFRYIVAKCDELRLSRELEQQRSTDQDNLEYHSGYIPPLFFTATKCRVPGVRLAALRQLRNLRVLENNWTSCTAYHLACKIISIETNRAIVLGRTRATESGHVSYYGSPVLLRPIEAFVIDETSKQAVLTFTFPSDELCSGLSQSEDSSPATVSTTFQEMVDFDDCTLAAYNRWPLGRILRIGGYQGGAVKPLPTYCECELSMNLGLCDQRPLQLRPKC